MEQSHNIALALNFKVQTTKAKKKVSVTCITPIYSPFSHIIRPALYRSWNILKSHAELHVTFQVSSYCFGCKHDRSLRYLVVHNPSQKPVSPLPIVNYHSGNGAQRDSSKFSHTGQKRDFLFFHSRELHVVFIRCGEYHQKTETMLETMISYLREVLGGFYFTDVVS